MTPLACDIRRVYHILVVEDDSSIAELLFWVLTDAGYRVTCAGTLAEARQVCRDQRPDAIIADLLLPDGIGSELLQDGCNTFEDRKPPSLIMSALPQAQALARAAGATLCMAKPFDLSDLLDAVKRLTQWKSRIDSSSGGARAS